MSQARHNSKEQYSFWTKNIKEDKFYFVIQGDEPVKLGDGTFGVVYQVQDGALNDFAVKILYENQALDQATVQPGLSNDIICSFREHFNLQNEDPVLEKLKNLQQPTDDLSSFTLGLKNTVIDDDKYTFLVRIQV